MKIMRFNLVAVLWAALLLSSVSLFGQTCAPFQASTSGTLGVKFITETEECFRVRYQGDWITPEPVSSLVFQSSPGFQKVKVVMENGAVIEKNLGLSVDQAFVVYEIKKKKKGKYALKVKLGQSQLTAAAQQKQSSDQEEFWAKEKAKEDARKAEREKADAKWDADIAAKRARMKESVKIDDPVEEEEEASSDDSDEPASSSSSSSSSSKGSSTSGSSTSSSGKGGSSTSSSKGSSSTSSGSSSLEPKKTYGMGKNTFMVQVMYKEHPITDTEITISINKHVLGKGVTDENGVVKMRTDYDVPSSIAIDLEGEKGNKEWKIEGFYYLNEPPKGTLLKLDDGVSAMAGMMGISGSSLAKMWGFE